MSGPNPSDFAFFAPEFCEKAAELVAGDRRETHGDFVEGFATIAAYWNTYLGDRLGDGPALNEKDVGCMLVLLKMQRTSAGKHNPDDYVDICGYSGGAGEAANKIFKGAANAKPTT